MPRMITYFRKLILMPLKISAWVLLPVGLALLRLRCRALGYRSAETGHCWFWGPPEFLTLCLKSMQRLSTMDQSLYESLSGQNLTIWYEPNGPAVFLRHFGISENFAAWKEQGIIACIICAHFTERLRLGRRLSQRLFDDPIVIRERIHESVRAWLDQHGFANELIECFA